MSLKSRIATLTREGQSLMQEAGRIMVRFGLILADVDALIREHGEKSGYGSIRLYIEAEYPQHAGPVYGSSDGYRALQAGRVALILGGDVQDASVDALTFLHRFIDNPADVLAVWKHAKGRKAASPTRAALVASATAVLGVEKAQAGKAGPKAGSAKAGNGARAKAAKAGTTRKPAETKSSPAESREVPVREVPNVTETATKAATLRLRKVLGTVETDSLGTVLALMQNVAKACDDIGSGNVLAALHVLADETKGPKKAATPRKRTARNTRKAATKAAA